MALVPPCFAGSIHILTPIKKLYFADPPEVPTLEGQRYRAGLGILSQTNGRHFAAFGSGATRQGLCP